MLPAVRRSTIVGVAVDRAEVDRIGFGRHFPLETKIHGSLYFFSALAPAGDLPQMRLAGGHPERGPGELT
jgi:hypothetical protein